MPVVAAESSAGSISVSGDAERDREEAARTYYDEHGRWPDGE
jgi:hypothetical protein